MNLLMLRTMYLAPKLSRPDSPRSLPVNLWVKGACWTGQSNI